MAEQPALAAHELLEVHELLQSEVIGLKKLQAGFGEVRDQQLRDLMQSMVCARQGRIAALYQFASSLQGVGRSHGAGQRQQLQ